MPIIPVKTPKLVKVFFPRFYWNIKTNENVIYLTFDDGPTPKVTPWVLKTLKLYNAKATFFCVGKNIENNATIFKQIINDGHAIGNHTYNHVKGWNVSVDNYIEEIELTQNIINSNLQKISALNSSKIKNIENLRQKRFRPPYGKFTKKQYQHILSLGYKIIMWDVLSYDWDKNLHYDQCLKNVIKNTKPGSIVVFHDSEKAFKNLKQTLPKVLEYFSAKDFKFKQISL